MWPFFLNTWRAGLRSRTVHGVLCISIVLVMLAYFSSYFSPRQPQTVALDVGLSGVRFSLVLFALFWVEQLVAKEIGSKGVLLALTYPIPRSRYLLGRFLGITSLLALSALLLGMMLWVVVFSTGKSYEQGFRLAIGAPYWMSILGFWCDAVVVAAFALTIACVSTVPMLPMALGLAFAIAGKGLGAVLDYFARGADGDVQVRRLEPVLDLVQWLLPDLSRLDWRGWPMYGLAPNEAVFWAILMAFGYILILFAFAIRMFNRREFS